MVVARVFFTASGLSRSVRLARILSCLAIFFNVSSALPSFFSSQITLNILVVWSGFGFV